MTELRSWIIIALLAFACAGFFGAAAAGGQPPAVPLNVWESPRPIPDLAFVDGDGKHLSLGAFRGKIILLNVWATWCPPCRKEMPALDRLEQTLGGPRFGVIALSTDSSGLQGVKAFYESLGLKSLRVFLDEEGSAMRDFRIIGLPTTLLIDEQGQEIARKIGPAAWDGVDVIAFLKARIDAVESVR